MTSTVDFFRHVLRYFPNTISVTLIVAGIALGQVAWILVAGGAIVLTLFIMFFQRVVFKSFGVGQSPGQALLMACSILPTVTDDKYYNIPSMWLALTSYFVSYILSNASYIYSARPSSSLSRDTTAVAQRKGVGLISMLAITVLFLFLAIIRCTSVCETRIGVISGILLGTAFGIGWWYLLHLGGPSISDIHGVLRGLSGVQQLGAQACTGGM